ncbi:Molybdopterin-binding protein [Candidatus Desulfarcum epimagneticum]|uniref:Molybdopterin molybdenumtransferase n=1 Tax=uncultured Desulfobacteraceae bacterium TaxID=218296 RepID=A0A484HEK9_9BACT|nr:Molybdopterin-binding protein [uncultured Desulfobacteraceae bacterium]
MTWEESKTHFMKKVKVEKALGMALAHDVTRIVPGRFKGPAFKKGHIIREEDIPELKRIGKNHIYALEVSESRIHEDAAALRICRAVSGPGLEWTEPSEGKSAMTARFPGILKVDAAGLLKINRIDDIIVSTLKTHFPCETGRTVAAARIIPLTISKKKMDRFEAVAARHHPVLRIMPYRTFKIGAVVTGTEIYNGLIYDEFDEYVKKAAASFGQDIEKKIVVPDDASAIAGAIGRLVGMGCDMIIATGGLSVDPDDVTRTGVLKAGAKLVAYGSPVIPGAMFLYARLGEIPIIGLPACVYYHRATVFNLIFPRILAGDEITKKDIAEMGHGGLCLNCETCRYPECSFGK